MHEKSPGETRQGFFERQSLFLLVLAVVEAHGGSPGAGKGAAGGGGRGRLLAARSAAGSAAMPGAGSTWHGANPSRHCAQLLGVVAMK